jgi:hypothetical protein
VVSGRTDYHLVLAHLLQDPDYLTFYDTVPGFKILDNGAAEGSTVGHEELVEAGVSIGVDEIVVPDVLRDCNATLDSTREFETVSAGWVHGSGRPRFMGVVQGTSISEYTKCLRGFAHMFPWITTIGIPRHSLDSCGPMFRRMFAEFIGNEFGNRYEIHCLGANVSHAKEPLFLSHCPIIRGMDTSLPVSMGLMNLDITYNSAVNRVENFFERTADRVQLDWINHNVDKYLEWCASPQAPGREVRGVSPQ